MKSLLLIITAVCIIPISIMSQKVEYQEFDLPNGLHVILHEDHSAPVVITSVMYHVGSKDENPNRTGFAHFFEHLLFEGTKNIKRGEWFKIVSSHGGTNNANTNSDRTYYYEIFPSNNLALGLWMESERMRHPVINQIGVDTQNEVVKEEKRLRVDNAPYGHLIEAVRKNLYKKHPYRWTTIGSMEHLDAATLDEFIAFNKKYYIPNNATLVVAGDIKPDEAKALIEKYFSDIPKKENIVREKIKEEPITQTIHAEYHDPNIQIPALVIAYRTPAMKERDAFVLDMISTILSRGKSSRLYKKMVDDKKMALSVFTFNYSEEDYSMYIIMALPQGKTTLEDLKKEIDEEIYKLQTELISNKELQRLKNQNENDFVNSNSTVEGIAHSLATFHTLFGNTSLINKQLEINNSITPEEIREVARKYLNPNQRLELKYLPKQENN